MNVTITESKPQQPQPKKEIYRYKFSQTLMDQLEIFALEHEDDNIEEFKDAWESWTEENATLLSTEISLLLEKNFQGDALEKMFFSARYYYRKKEYKKFQSTKTDNKENKENKKQNIKYASSKAFLACMDDHIEKQDAKAKPANAFIDFMKTHPTSVQEEYRFYINKIDQEKPEPNPEEPPKILDEKAFQDKLKKTYKNRIFVFRNPKPAPAPGAL
jgi:hypothetical protein